MAQIDPLRAHLATINSVLSQGYPHRVCGQTLQMRAVRVTTLRAARVHPACELRTQGLPKIAHF